MTLKPEDEHWHSGLAWDGKRIKATDLDWTGYNWSGWVEFFAFEIWWLSGWVADTMFRRFLMPWKEGDMQATFTDKIVLEWQTTTMSGRYTQRSNTDQWDGSYLTVKPWQIVDISCKIYSSWGNLRVWYTGWSYRLLYGNGLDLTQSWLVSFINASAVDMKLDFRYATSSSDRPIIGVFVKIY
jgi:hypothetical protein